MVVEKSPAPALGATLAELIRMPIDIVRDAVPEIQTQVRDMPNILRQNIEYGMKSFRDMPRQFQSGLTRDTANMPMMLAKAASPLPLLSPEEIAEKNQELISGSPKTDANSQKVASKIIEDRTKEFAARVTKFKDLKNNGQP